jgi:hypothetical protein
MKNREFYDDGDDEVSDDLQETVEDIVHVAKPEKNENKFVGEFLSPATLMKDRYDNFLDRDTIAANRLDTDYTEPEIVEDKDVAEIRRFKGRANDDEDKAEVGLHRLVKSATAKEQRNVRLAAATKEFDMSLLKAKPGIKLPAPANANAVSFKETESCPLLEQLNRTIFEPDEKQRNKFIGAVHHVQELIETAGGDALGLSAHRPGKEATPDHDMDRADSGKVIYGQGQSLDRKWRVYDHKNDETNALRHDGPVRTSKRSPGPISNGFDVNRDALFAERKVDAQIELEDMAAVVGPLWLPFLNAAWGNAGFTDVAAALGSKQPGVGSVILKLALNVIVNYIEAKHYSTSFLQYVQDYGLPVSARRLGNALKDAQPDHLQAKHPATDC